MPCGTTGESATLSHTEHADVIQAVVKQARGRVPVIASTGSNSTQEAVELTRLAAEAGADATLQVGPYYNKPTQDGLFDHFAAVARGDRICRCSSTTSRAGRAGTSSRETIIRLWEEMPQHGRA